jgi:class 3 adenylate cyclase/tetratricopeptide (TPR) repeat protein
MMDDNPQSSDSTQLYGGEAVTFDEILEHALEMLQRRGRVSYRALKVQFHMDDDLLEILKEEIVEVHQVARDQEGKMLVWTGATATAAPSFPPAPDQERAPLTYTPPYLAEKILTSRSALEGERKQVTVLFADLKGSMELLADRDPEEARQLLDPVLERMMAAVHRYEGTVNQVLGDGIMALFGAPLAHEDHAVRACYAALAMQAAVKQYAAEVQRTQGVPVQIRVGLNAGEVVVRAIGNDLHMDYSAIGQTTHLAARMEQMAMPGSILMTRAVLGLAEGWVQVTPLGPVPVKGLDALVEVFELVSASGIRRRLQTAAVRGLTRFVGRDTELAALVHALARAEAGHGQVVALVGEAGVGKSRLVYELTHSHHLQGWRVLESASVSYGKATPYFPVIDLLKRYSHVEDDDDARTMRAKVTGQVLTLDEALQDTIPALLALLDALPSESPFLQLDPPQRRQRTLDALKRVLLRESQGQPLLLVCEDLHWIDSETQTLLDSLVESLPTAHLLLLVNYRPEYQHRWSAKTYYTQVRLDPLAPVSADQLLQALLGTDPSLAPLTHLLITRTEGNPFFLEESVRTLVETGVLVGEPGAYHVAQALPTIQVPATVQAVLAARIDRLPLEEKHLLQIAAVVGHEVPLPLLQAIADLSEDALHRSLAQLQRAEFLYETRLFPEREYTFKHALTHEVAYGSLLQERRRILHAGIVEALERLAPDRLAEQSERLAHHALRGEVWDKALVYFRQAGERALARSAHREAVGYFEQALRVLPHLPDHRGTREQAIDLRFALRTALQASGDLGRILTVLREAEALAAALDDPRRLGQVSIFMNQYFFITGDPDQAIVSCQRALAMASGDVGLQAVANNYLGMAYHTQGEYQQAIAYCRRTVAALDDALRRERFGQVILPAVASRTFLGWSLAEMGQFAEGLAIGEEGCRIAEVVGLPGSLMFAYFGAGLPSLRQGDLLQTLPRLERAAGLCQEADLPLWFPWVAWALGSAYVLCQRVTDALMLLEQAVEQSASMGRWAYHALFVATLGEALLRAGHLVEAHHRAEQALAFARTHKERSHEAWALRVLGEMAAQRDPPDGAEAATYYRQSLALADALGMRPLVAHCHCGLGSLYTKIGRWDAARGELSAAIELYRAMEMTFWLPQARAAVAEVDGR